MARTGEAGREQFDARRGGFGLAGRERVVLAGEFETVHARGWVGSRKEAGVPPWAPLLGVPARLTHQPI
ncbi:hypothetical protein JCM18549_25950 [Halolamina salina]